MSASLPWYQPPREAGALDSSGLSTGTGALLVLGAIGLLVLVVDKKLRKE